LFRVEDGSFVRQLATELSDGPWDVEDCEGGWLVACPYWIEFVTGDVDGGGAGRVKLGKRGRGNGGGVGRPRLGKYGSGDGEFNHGPTALALVPGLGLVVRESGNGGRLQVFTVYDTVAMASMSVSRVAWMAAVARGIALRWAPEQGAAQEVVVDEEVARRRAVEQAEEATRRRAVEETEVVRRQAVERMRVRLYVVWPLALHIFLFFVDRSPVVLGRAFV
jgi:hypothetical protein